MEFKFKPEDFANIMFAGLMPIGTANAQVIADIANKCLAEMLKQCTTVYGNGINPAPTEINHDFYVWSYDRQDTDTHAGKIVDIQELK